ncbi:MAG: ABC transporter ATP-binding protein [Enterocloster sp.]
MNKKDIIVSAKDLCKWFPVKNGNRREKKYVKAVNNITLDIYKGETLGIVGESGCGKTTLGRTLIRLNEPTSGRIIFDGKDITSLKENELRPLRKDMQIIFQDPYSSLDPRMTVGDIIAEPYVFQNMYSRRERMEKVKELMDLCGLDTVYVRRYPHEFSGGQRQRIGIARALALNPKFMVCDEPVSALDVSIQSQIINLLMQLQERMGLTYAFISHNLNVVHHISDRIAVMYLGHLVELADKQDLYHHPGHPYTVALLKSIPMIDFTGEHTISAQLSGDLPSPVDPPSGCVFHTRCRHTCDRCRQETPALRELEPNHFVACHRAEELMDQIK